MNQLDTSGRLERDMAALQKAGTLPKNLDCLVILILAAVLGLVGVAAVFAGGFVGAGLLVGTIVVGIIAWVTKIGEGIMIGVVGILAIGAGALAVVSAIMSAAS